MSLSYRDDVILARASALGAADIDRANAILDAAGLGRPLDGPGSSLLDLVEVPLTGADPVAVRDALRAARGRGEDVPEYLPDPLYSSDTVEDAAQDRDLQANGKKLGHGLFAWLPVSPDRLPQPPAWQPAGNPPVIALLDTGVQDHSWLPEPYAGTPFWEDADWESAQPTGAVPARAAGLGDEDGATRQDFGSHWGHATFIAGLIRLAAPGAQVLSLRVMNNRGSVSEARVIAALDWLARERYRGRRIDVVLMAFGRPREAEDDTSHLFAELRRAVNALAALDVRIVASAGNDSCTRPTVPACFADEPNAPVVSVGAGCSGSDPAWFSNRGSWVKQWRPGSDLLSIMPLRPDVAGAGDECARWKGTPFATEDIQDGNGAARWSGNSFSAAVVAAELARTANARKPSAVGP
jgi:subtilase family protein